jgi:hypothetical protein
MNSPKCEICAAFIRIYRGAKCAKSTYVHVAIRRYSEVKIPCEPVIMVFARVYNCKLPLVSRGRI